MGIATIAEQAVDSLLTNFVTTKSAALCSALAPLALTGVTIYIILMGWAIMRGEAHDSFHTFVWKSFKIAIVSSLALSSGEYQGLVIEGVNGVQGTITSVFGAGTLGGVIDNALLPYQSLGSQLASEAVTGVLPNLALLAAAGMVAIGQIAITVVALGMYLMAKIALALVLAVGPLFIFCAMFPITSRFTELWIGQALQFTLVNGLLAGVIAMLYSIAEQFAIHIQTNVGATQILTDTVMLLGITAALCVVVFNVQGIASALSGGVGLQGMGREIGQAAMRLVHGFPGSRSGSKNTISGRVGAGLGSSTEAASHGNSAVPPGHVPLYRRHTLDRIRQST